MKDIVFHSSKNKRELTKRIFPIKEEEINKANFFPLDKQIQRAADNSIIY